MNRFLPVLLLLLLAGSMAACGDDDPAGPGGSDDPELLTAATVARNIALLTEVTASIVAASAVGIVTDAAVPKTTGASCPDVTIGSDRQNQTVTILMDAGTGCSWNGRTVRGAVAITVVQGQGGAPTNATAAFNAFSIEDRTITGTVATEITLEDGTATGTATTDLSVVDPTSTTSLDGDFDVVVATSRTPDLSDDAATFSGTAQIAQGGLIAANSAITISEASPISFSGTCAYPQSGIVQAEVTSGSNTLPPVTIDFQPEEGDCDSMASIAVTGIATQTVDFVDLIGDFN